MSSLLGVRVEMKSARLQGIVTEDPGHTWVRVLWNDEIETWSRRDLLYLVGEWSMQ